jgi:hypothetical protein
MSKHDVYSTDDNWFFSDGVTRAFGENRHVQLDDGRIVANVVQPLNVDPAECTTLRKVGFILNIDDEAFTTTQ